MFKSRETQSRSVFSRVCGEERTGTDYLMESWGNENILELVVMVGQGSDDPKCCSMACFTMLNST